MNQQWRAALQSVGDGATPEKLSKTGISEHLLAQLLVAGLVRIERLNNLEAYGALNTQPVNSVTSYRLTATGAEAIGSGV